MLKKWFPTNNVNHIILLICNVIHTYVCIRMYCITFYSKKVFFLFMIIIFLWTVLIEPRQQTVEQHWLTVQENKLYMIRNVITVLRIGLRFLIPKHIYINGL